MRTEVKQYLKEHTTIPARVTDDSETLGSRLLTHDHAFGLYGTGLGHDAVVFGIDGHGWTSRNPGGSMMGLGRFLSLCQAASRPGAQSSYMWSVSVEFPDDNICILSRKPAPPVIKMIDLDRRPNAINRFNTAEVLRAYHEHLVGMAVRKARHETRALYMPPREFKS